MLKKSYTIDGKINYYTLIVHQLNSHPEMHLNHICMKVNFTEGVKAFN